MRYDEDKVDNCVLALLYLTIHDDGTRAWKSHDWAVLDRLQEKGFIGNPKNMSKSVFITQEGRAKAEELF